METKYSRACPATSAWASKPPVGLPAWKQPIKDLVDTETLSCFDLIGYDGWRGQMLVTIWAVQVAHLKNLYRGKRPLLMNPSQKTEMQVFIFPPSLYRREVWDILLFSKFRENNYWEGRQGLGEITHFLNSTPTAELTVVISQTESVSPGFHQKDLQLGQCWLQFAPAPAEAQHRNK